MIKTIVSEVKVRRIERLGSGLKKEENNNSQELKENV